MAENPNPPGQDAEDNSIGFYDADEEGSYDEAGESQGEPRPDADTDPDPAGDER